MKEQRWPGDYRTVPEDFAYARREEQIGIDEDRANRDHDYLALGVTRTLDPYQTSELEPSWCTQLDTVGMQPHAREYLERDLTAIRSGRKYNKIAGQIIDHPEGIHFGDMP